LTPKQLSTANHDRDAAGLRYVYPVMSRRSGGLSIGINFNTNNACNWRCIYCQVPGLTRGAAPALDLHVLEHELRGFLDQVLNGEFYENFGVAEAHRVIKDIALSGNGEPTSLKNFAAAVRLIADIASAAGVFPLAKFILITNGSLMQRPEVQQGLATLARHRGEVWFKVDSGSVAVRQLINGVTLSQEKLLANLDIASSLCPTRLQTCMVHYRNTWSDEEKSDYLALLAQIRQNAIDVRQVMLYSLARVSWQPEAPELQAVSREDMVELAADIEALGFDVSIND